MQVSYASPDELWSSVRSNKDKAWYAPAVEYWDRQPASYDGVLAGAPQLLALLALPARCLAWLHAQCMHAVIIWR